MEVPVCNCDTFDAVVGKYRDRFTHRQAGEDKVLIRTACRGAAAAPMCASPWMVTANFT